MNYSPYKEGESFLVRSEMEKREFLKSLESYYREKGKHPPPVTPYLAGRPISLHILFERVTKLGGSYLLNDEDRWQDILSGRIIL